MMVAFDPLYFAFAQTHSSMKRDRSSIFIFCSSARFSHSRIFDAFSVGIIISGAVAFMRSASCADAACARNVARVKAAKNRVVRYECICDPVARDPEFRLANRESCVTRPTLGQKESGTSWF